MYPVWPPRNMTKDRFWIWILHLTGAYQQAEIICKHGQRYIDISFCMYTQNFFVSNCAHTQNRLLFNYGLSLCACLIANPWQAPLSFYIGVSQSGLRRFVYYFFNVNIQRSITLIQLRFLAFSNICIIWASTRKYSWLATLAKGYRYFVFSQQICLLSHHISS